MDISSDAVARRTKTLTAILHGIYDSHLRHPTKVNRDPIPKPLRHLATLLHRGQPLNLSDYCVVAVTGAVEVTSLSILVVAQNSMPAPKGAITLRAVDSNANGTRLSDLLRDWGRDRSLEGHLQDILATMTLFDQPSQRYVGSMPFEVLRFFVGRSYHALRRRVQVFAKNWELDRFDNWNPNSGENVFSKCPIWIPDLPCIEILRPSNPPYFAVMRRRERETENERITEWEFSQDTAKGWVGLLTQCVRELEKAVEEQEPSISGQSEKPFDPSTVASLCSCLHVLLIWGGGFLSKLLTSSSLGRAHHPTYPIRGDSDDNNSHYNIDPDELESMKVEQGETGGEQCLRHLRSISAWAAAVFYLFSDAKESRLLRSQELFRHAGLVEVTTEPTQIHSIVDVVDQFRLRFAEESPEVIESLKSRLSTSKLYSKALGPEPQFPGAIHAEAILMGIFECFQESTHELDVLFDPGVGDDNRRQLRSLIATVSTSKIIAVPKKCCWCCRWLSDRLQDTIVAGHNTIYPWSPPCHGIGTGTLQDLETALWVKLKSVIANASIRG